MEKRKAAYVKSSTNTNCAICLERIQDLGYCDPCMHTFCVDCIMKWLRRKQSCPKCRQKVYGIICHVRSDDDYDELVFDSPRHDHYHVSHPTQIRKAKPGRDDSRELVNEILNELLVENASRPQPKYGNMYGLHGGGSSNTSRDHFGASVSHEDYEEPDYEEPRYYAPTRHCSCATKFFPPFLPPYTWR
jgi:hypothetical protein